MASNSKTINLGGANVYIQRCTLTAYFNETGTNTANNTSTINCKASLYTPSASWDNGSGRDDHLRVYWHDNRENYDRLVATWSGSSVWSPTTITAEGTIDVTHKDDGTLSGYAWATWSRDGGNTSYAPASGDVATDWTDLTTIARASQPSINTYPNNSPDFDIGDTITIHMNRKSNQFTHTVKINYGNTTQTIATGVTDNCTFDTSTIANDLYALIPDANTYSGTISVTTYNGSANIGTKTCAYNANVANSNPTWANFDRWVAYTKDTHVRTALANSNVNFLQGMSIIEFQGNKRNAPVALNGASLASITVSIADAIGTVTWNASLPTNIAFDIGNPTQAGMMTLNAVVTDSRGNASTFQRDVYVIPYQAPGIAASCVRQSNFENNTTITIRGSMASVKFGIGDTTTERNSVDPTNGVAYRYKESTSQTWSSWIDVASTTTAGGTVTTTPFILSLDNQKEWEFEFSIIDFFNSETTIARHVGQGQPQFFIGADGRTSVGGVPQIAMPSGNLGQLEVNGNAYANGHRLAELPLTSEMIGSKTVVAENIDFSTTGGALQYVARFPINKRTYNNGFVVFDDPSVFLQTDQDVKVTRYNSNLFLRLDLPTDKQYVAKIETQLWTPQNSWDYILVELRKNGSGFARVMAPKINGLWGFAATHGWQKVENTDYISEYINTSGNNFSDGNMSPRDTYIEVEIWRVR